MITGSKLELLVLSQVANYDPHLLKHDCLDVRLDSIIKVENGRTFGVNLNTRTPMKDIYDEVLMDPTYTMMPGEFVIGQLQEYITVPPDHAAMFTLRSFAAQRGLEQSSSLWLKPGWSGHLVVELCNFFKRKFIVLEDGLPIGQVHFFKTSCDVG